MAIYRICEIARNKQIEVLAAGIISRRTIPRLLVEKAVSGMPFCYLAMGVEKWFDSIGVRNPFDSILLAKKKLVLCPRNLSEAEMKKAGLPFRMLPVERRVH